MVWGCMLSEIGLLAVLDQVLGDLALRQKASAVTSLSFRSRGSRRGMAILISLVRLASSRPSVGRVPTFFGRSSFDFDDRRH
jgi:hypothetical protein